MVEWGGLGKTAELAPPRSVTVNSISVRLLWVSRPKYYNLTVCICGLNRAALAMHINCNVNEVHCKNANVGDLMHAIVFDRRTGT